MIYSDTKEPSSKTNYSSSPIPWETKPDTIEEELGSSDIRQEPINFDPYLFNEFESFYDSVP